MTAEPAPVLIRDDQGWAVANIRWPDGRLVTVRCRGKGEATSVYLRAVGLLPPAPKPEAPVPPARTSRV